MSQSTLTQLPDALLSVLRAGCPALLLTVGVDGFAHTAYTWAVALDATTLHFAADHGSSTLANLEREQRAALQIISRENLIFLIKGAATPVKPQLEAAPFKIALWALAVRGVKDQSWPGVRVQPLGYEWPPEQREAMLAIEQAVYTEMRTWQI
ncbi:MAG TPA: pyridoxamine 5'-phosphate oxidase family protein [Anaerolineae bacterium]|nr:pyridoxamine 5'-phosphate oxidase family protein [Anaerolineae bacterium]